MSKKLPISLCTFVKNEEASIRDCIESVYPIVSEVVVVDTGSEDSTIKICQEYTDRIYRVGFSDFSSIRTLAAHLSNQHWVLQLDADERLSADWGKLEELISEPIGVQGDDMELDEFGNVIIDSWALPRKRWADIWMSQQVDAESYPDWQVRLFRNHLRRPKIKFIRRVHETVSGCIKTEYAHDGPIINHLQNVNKSREDLERRQKLYTELYNLDIAEGIHHSEPPVVDIDKVQK